MQTPKKHLQPAFSTLVRWHYWKATVEVIKQSPLTGVGLGNFDLERWSHYAHNSYLQIWAEMGIPGIIAFLWLIALLITRRIKNLAHSRDKPYLAALLAANAAFLIHNLVDFTFFLPEVCTIWWILAGISYTGTEA
jgi:putative inorganic carbon (HCO3(-)) transporter